MLFNITKRVDDDKVVFIGKNRTEVENQHEAVQLSETDARNYIKVLQRDFGVYGITEDLRSERKYMRGA